MLKSHFINHVTRTIRDRRCHGSRSDSIIQQVAFKFENWHSDSKERGIIICTLQRIGRLSMQGWHRYGILIKQKLYNFTTNMLEAYLSTQFFSSSAFMISKTHLVAQKPRERQLNTKCAVTKVPFFVFFPSLCYDHYVEH